MLKILKSRSITNVVLVDIDANKAKLASEIGASKTFKFEDKEQCRRALEDWYQDDLPRVAIDTTGKVPCIELAYEVSHSMARVILVGVPRKGEKSSIYTLPLHFGKVFVGSQGGGSRPEVDIPYLLSEMESERLSFSDFPTHVFQLTEINNAISNLRSGALGRMIIQMEGAR